MSLFAEDIEEREMRKRQMAAARAFFKSKAQERGDAESDDPGYLAAVEEAKNPELTSARWLVYPRSQVPPGEETDLKSLGPDGAWLSVDSADLPQRQRVFFRVLLEKDGSEVGKATGYTGSNPNSVARPDDAAVAKWAPSRSFAEGERLYFVATVSDKGLRAKSPVMAWAEPKPVTEVIVRLKMDAKEAQESPEVLTLRACEGDFVSEVELKGLKELEQGLLEHRFADVPKVGGYDLVMTDPGDTDAKCVLFAGKTVEQMLTLAEEAADA